MLQRLVSVDPTPIGRGGFGVVYKGSLVKNSLPVAVKTIPNDHRAHREMDILESLQYSNKIIPKLYYNIEDGDQCHLVMEYIGGRDMNYWVQKKLPENVISQVIRNILQCLKTCHTNNIIYGDLKLTNIVATQSLMIPCERDRALVKVVDYGSAHRFMGKNFTKPFGTYTFMAPEMFLHNFGLEVDMWALGICTYILTTGMYPYTLDKKHMTKEHIADRILNESISFHTIPVSESCQDFLKGLLEEDPEKRMTVDEALDHPWIVRKRNLTENTMGNGRINVYV
jgi:serine/threonine protein kinase